MPEKDKKGCNTKKNICFVFHRERDLKSVHKNEVPAQLSWQFWEPFVVHSLLNKGSTVYMSLLWSFPWYILVNVKIVVFTWLCIVGREHRIPRMVVTWYTIGMYWHNLRHGADYVPYVSPKYRGNSPGQLRHQTCTEADPALPTHYKYLHIATSSFSHSRPNLNL